MKKPELGLKKRSPEQESDFLLMAYGKKIVIVKGGAVSHLWCDVALWGRNLRRGCTDRSRKVAPETVRHLAFVRQKD